MAANSKTFKPGVSGNPSGRPKGARHAATILAERLMQDDTENVVKAVLAAAAGGDMQAARIVLDRLAPVRRDRPIEFSLPPLTTTADLTTATSALLVAVAAGEITPSEAAELGRLVDAHVRAVEAVDLDARLRRLEEAPK